eukprot:TRINITY_DN11357_c0_g1_i1.p1 TRINITY_DN11357_c0_g1~~TRINITY_DN11357_c0_g1_i1.p1  ORF type:complete len:292 (+),score=44.69 TRINITY_DN11357_c0_g1_i1:123-998(+)
MYYDTHVKTNPKIPKETFTQEHQNLVSLLEKKIDTYTQRFPDGAFVRLSTRSPKDSALGHPKTAKNFESELAKQPLPDSATTLEIENNRLIALINSATKALRVTSGAEAMALFLRSERVNEDLKLALEFPKQWKMHVAIRRWQYAQPEMEFRGFVFNGELTGLSQYFHIVYFDTLFRNRDKISSAIRDYYNQQIKDKFTGANCVMDFGIILKSDSTIEIEKVFVIELNPFADYADCGTDPGLFSWKTDREILEGKKPFQFRICDSLFDVKPKISRVWRAIVEGASPESALS